MDKIFKDLQLGSIELFCSAAELKSFSQAAVAVGVTPAAVSRSIARLEERLGVQLFVRTTRQVRLTESGQAFYNECSQALSQIVEAEHKISGKQLEPAGVIRVSVPTTYGHHRILPALPEFHAQYPQVDIDIHVSNQNIEFTERGFDLAVRARPPSDSRLVARKLEDAELVVVAAPNYIKQHGQPQSIGDLEAHECIQFALPSTGKNVPWQFTRDNKEVMVSTNGQIKCYESVLSGVTLARAGMGLFQTMRFVVEDDLRNGQLIEVLPQNAGCVRPFSVLYPSAKYQPLRVRVFIDFLLNLTRG